MDILDLIDQLDEVGRAAKPVPLMHAQFLITRDDVYKILDHLRLTIAYSVRNRSTAVDDSSFAEYDKIFDEPAKLGIKSAFGYTGADESEGQPDVEAAAPATPLGHPNLLDLLDRLDDEVHKAPLVPFSKKVRVKRTRYSEIVDLMRQTFPDSIRRGTLVIDDAFLPETQRVLSDGR